MRRKQYNSLSDFCSGVSDLHDLLYSFLGDNYPGTAIVGSYDVIFDVLNHLVKNYTYDIKNADFTEPDYNDYVDEYVLILVDDYICVEKMKYSPNSSYINLCDYLTFIHGDCNSAILKANKKTSLIEFDYYN